MRSQQFFSNPAKRDPFYRALDEVSSSGTTQEAVNRFDQWWNNIRFSTYIASISEHHRKEDLHGRLSMWRAFGGSGAARVAIVFRVPWVANGSAALNLMFNPVAYLREDEAHAAFGAATANITADLEFCAPSVERR